MSVDEITTYWSSYNNTNPNPSIFQVSNTNLNDGSTVERRIWENGTNCVTTQNLRLSVVDMIGLEALGIWILMPLLKYGILFLNTT